MTANAGITWSADTAAIERAHAKMVKQMAELREEIRKLKKESKDAGDAQGESFRKQGRALDATKASAKETIGAMAGFSKVREHIVGMVGPLLTVQAGLGAARTLTRAWIADTERLIEVRKQLDKQTLGASTPSGIPTSRIEKWLDSDTKTTATRVDRVEALEAVAKTAPDMKESRQFQIAGVTAQQAVRGNDVHKPIGALAGDVGNILSNRDAGDVVDVAAKLQTQLGDKAGGFGSDAFQRGIASLTSKGMAGEDAIAHAVAALRGDQKGQVLDRLAKGDAGAKKWFAGQDVQGISRELGDAMGGDFRDKTLADLQTSRAGSVAVADKMVTKRTEDASQSRAAGEWEQVTRTNQFIRDSAWEKGPVAYAGAVGLSMANRSDQFLPRFLRHSREDETGPDKALDVAERYGIMTKGESQAFRGQEARISQGMAAADAGAPRGERTYSVPGQGKSGGGGGSTGGKDMEGALIQNAQATERNTKALETANRRRAARNISDLPE